jgi:hypothetical protein
MFECRHYHGLAMATTSEVRVCDHILQEPMAPSAAKQVRCHDEHTSRGYTIIFIRHEDAHSPLRQGLQPDALGSLSWLNNCTHLRRLEEGEE